jgi:hypothetical protein
MIPYRHVLSRQVVASAAKLRTLFRQVLLRKLGQSAFFFDAVPLVKSLKTFSPNLSISRIKRILKNKKYNSRLIRAGQAYQPLKSQQLGLKNVIFPYPSANNKNPPPPRCAIFSTYVRILFAAIPPPFYTFNSL